MKPPTTSSRACGSGSMVSDLSCLHPHAQANHIKPITSEHYMNKKLNRHVTTVAEVVSGFTSAGQPRPGGGLLRDTERRIARARDDDMAMSTKAKLIGWRGDLLYLLYCVQGGAHEEKHMVVPTAVSEHFFVLAGIPSLIHSNADNTASSGEPSSLSSSFDAMCAGLLPQSVTPPSDYYLVSATHRFCSCPFVLTNGPFNKV